MTRTPTKEYQTITSRFRLNLKLNGFIGKNRNN